MTDDEIRLYSAIRVRFDPRAEINLREISTLARLDRDQVVVGYRGLYAFTLAGMDLWRY